MFDHFNEIQKTHPIEDEMLTNLLRIGICKAIAVLGKVFFHLRDSSKTKLTTYTLVEGGLFKKSSYVL